MTALLHPLPRAVNPIFCDCGRPACWLLASRAGPASEYSLHIPLCPACRQIELDSPRLEPITQRTLASNRHWLHYDFRWHP